MNPITLHVEYADGTTAEAIATAPDFVAFEAKFDKSIQSFSNDVRLTYLFFIAWNSLNRRKETKLGFDAWVETVAGIEVDDPKA
jgi:hypothetical protein